MPYYLGDEVTDIALIFKMQVKTSMPHHVGAGYIKYDA
jgi:hypothetical protein